MDFIDHRSAATFKFGLSATDEKLRITSDGDVGIGTSSPTNPLTVVGTGASTLTASKGAVVDYQSSSVSNIVPIGFSWSSSTSNQNPYWGMAFIPTNYSSAIGELGFYTGNTERMRIDSSGNVGIGTASPSTYSTASELVVDTGVSGGITVVSDSTSGGYGGVFFADGTTGNEQYRGFVQYNHNNGGSVDSLVLGAAGAEAMRIDSSGNVGINTTDIGANLSVRGNASTGVINVIDVGNNQNAATVGDGARIRLHCTPDENRGVAIGSLSEVNFAVDNSMVFYTSTASTLSEKMRISSAGNVGIGTSSPDNLLDIYGTDDREGVFVRNSTNTNYRGYYMGATDVDNVPYGGIELNANSGELRHYAGPSVYGGFQTFYSSGTERMRLDTSGNVGIGTSSPSAKLDLGSSTGQKLLMYANNNIKYGMSIETSEYRMFAEDQADLTFGHMARSDGSTYSEAMRIDSSGNVLVGGPSAFGADTITLGTGGFAGIRNTSGSCMELRRDGTDGSLLDFQKDGTTVGSIGTVSGLLGIGSGDAILAFDSTANAMYPMSSQAGGASNGDLDFGSSLRRFKDLYLSGGVYLGGTGSANKLDDYEEGTFTPTFIGTGGNPTVTYDTTVGNVGTYVKIGKVCHFQINIRTDSVSGGSGDLKVSGLPFTSKSGTGQIGISTAAIRATSFASNTPRVATISEGVTVVNLMTRTSITGDDSPTAVSALATGADSNLLRITGTYEVA